MPPPKKKKPERGALSSDKLSRYSKGITMQERVCQMFSILPPDQSKDSYLSMDELWSKTSSMGQCYSTKTLPPLTPSLPQLKLAVTNHSSSPTQTYSCTHEPVHPTQSI